MCALNYSDVVITWEEFLAVFFFMDDCYVKPGASFLVSCSVLSNWLATEPGSLKATAMKFVGLQASMKFHC